MADHLHESAVGATFRGSLDIAWLRSKAPSSWGAEAAHRRPKIQPPLLHGRELPPYFREQRNHASLGKHNVETTNRQLPSFISFHHLLENLYFLPFVVGVAGGGCLWSVKCVWT